jgi:hypothetical protein
MNKQEIEQAIAWNEDLLTYMKDQRATYEDVVGTGDLTEEERKQVYDSMDRDIKMFETIISALQQQLTNGWILIQKEPCTDSKICPVCNRIMSYDSYFKKMICRQCGNMEATTTKNINTIGEKIRESNDSLAAFIKRQFGDDRVFIQGKDFDIEDYLNQPTTYEDTHQNTN